MGNFLSVFVFWVVMHVDMQVDANVSEEETASIFRAQYTASNLKCQA
jgi:hypothetical protein